MITPPSSDVNVMLPRIVRELPEVAGVDEILSPSVTDVTKAATVTGWYIISPPFT